MKWLWFYLLEGELPVAEVLAAGIEAGFDRKVIKAVAGEYAQKVRGYDGVWRWIIIKEISTPCGMPVWTNPLIEKFGCVVAERGDHRPVGEGAPR